MTFHCLSPAHLKHMPHLDTQVLLEWCDSECRREWVDLTNNESFQAVYIEKELLWARRVLPSEQQRAVAWPARVSTLATPPCPPPLSCSLSNEMKWSPFKVFLSGML